MLAQGSSRFSFCLFRRRCGSSMALQYASYTVKLSKAVVNFRWPCSSTHSIVQLMLFALKERLF